MEDNIDEEINVFEIIGQIEITKRELAYTEDDLYDLEKTFKKKDDRIKLAKEWKLLPEQLEKQYYDLKFRRKLYKKVRKEAKENNIDKSEEN